MRQLVSSGAPVGTDRRVLAGGADGEPRARGGHHRDRRRRHGRRAPVTPTRQARHALLTIERALNEAGAGLRDVVRTRMFVTDIARWEEVGRAHGEFFRDVRPAATMVEVRRLIDPDHLVEIEVDAVH